jgi:DNA-binding YbaB/EbfC family protein
MVKCTANGEMTLTSLTIDPEAVDPDDVELLQDMVMAAVNEALSSAQDAAGAKMSEATGGMNIPGMF